jgi:YVTN family beta-propeller protein
MKTRRRTLLRRIGVLLAFTLGVCAVAISQLPLAGAQNAPTATPLPLFALPDARINTARQSNSVLLGSDGQTVVATNPLNDTVTFVQPLSNRVLSEVSVGDEPRSVTLTDDGTRVLVTNRASGTLTILDVVRFSTIATIPLGVLPYGVVSKDQRAYVSLQGSDEVLIVDLPTQQISARIATPALPTGLALWGEFLYVTHLWTGQVSVIYLPQQSVIRTVSMGADAGLSVSIELDVSRGLAYLPQTRSNASNTALTYDTTFFAVVNVLNLSDTQLRRTQRINLNTADRSVNAPIATALDRFNQVLYVVNSGSNDLSIIDLNTGQARAHLPVGAGPRGAVLNSDGSFLFVHNALDGTITIIDTRNLRVQDVVPISDLRVSADVLLGAQLFHNADNPRLSADNNMSCMNCHFDGLSDGRTWMLPDGPRNTPLLFNSPSTPPYNWGGTWDELADVEAKIRSLQAGAGLIDGAVFAPFGESNNARSLDMDTLVTYLQTLDAPTSPYQDAPTIASGQAVFAAQNCASCHIGDSGTDLQNHDVGTGGAFNTPTLRWLWLSAPYFHDGRAVALRDVFVLEGAHQLIYDVPPAEIDALVTYLESLPAPIAP